MKTNPQIENIYLVDQMGEGDRTTLTMFFAVNDAMDDLEKAIIIATLDKGDTYRGGGGASPLFWLVPHRAVNVGDRFVISQEVERYPHFNAPVGLTGTVTEIGGVVMGKMDLPLIGAEEWDNSIQFFDGAQSAIGALADFCWHTKPTDAPVAVVVEPTPKYLVEFPDFGPLDVTIPHGFDDSSWHNDTCPSWINETIHVRLMVDYADVAKSERAGLREIGHYERFHVDKLTDDNQVTGWIGNGYDTFDEALAEIIAEQFVFELSDEITHRVWSEMRRRNRINVDKGDDSCASHEFCDPNMSMELAFRMLGLLHDGNDDDWANEETPESKRLVGLWNAAWKIARDRHLTAPK